MSLSLALLLLLFLLMWLLLPLLVLLLLLLLLLLLRPWLLLLLLLAVVVFAVDSAYATPLLRIDGELPLKLTALALASIEPGQHSWRGVDAAGANFCPATGTADTSFLLDGDEDREPIGDIVQSHFLGRRLKYLAIGDCSGPPDSIFSEWEVCKYLCQHERWISKVVECCALAPEQASTLPDCSDTHGHFPFPRFTMRIPDSYHFVEGIDGKVGGLRKKMGKWDWGKWASRP